MHFCGFSNVYKYHIYAPLLRFANKFNTMIILQFIENWFMIICLFSKIHDDIVVAVKDVAKHIDETYNLITPNWKLVIICKILTRNLFF